MTNVTVKPLSGGWIVTDDEDLTRVMFGTKEEAEAMLEANPQKKAKTHEAHVENHVSQRSSKGSK